MTEKGPIETPNEILSAALKVVFLLYAVGRNLGNTCYILRITFAYMGVDGCQPSLLYPLYFSLDRGIP